MTPAKCPLVLYRGDTYHWTVRFWSDPEKTVPADLSEATPKAQIRDRPGGALIADLALAVVLPNTIDVSLAAADSAKLPAIAAWDLQLTYAASGDVLTPLAGPVTVTPDVTDSAPDTVTVPAHA